MNARMTLIRALWTNSLHKRHLGCTVTKEALMAEQPIRQPRAIDAQRELLTAKDVAAQLSLGVSTIWRQVKRGNLPAPIRIGGSTRWRRADIEALTAREAA